MAKKIAQEKLKKIKHKPLYIFLILFLIVGCVAGYFIGQKITENDCFQLIGEKFVEVEVGEVYKEEGIKAISFGKDISNKVQIEGDVDYNTPGKYLIKYTVDNFRFRGVERYRIITVLEVENAGA